MGRCYAYSNLGEISDIVWILLQIVSEMRRIAQAHPNLVQMSSLGKSYEGRDQYALTVSEVKC